MTVQMLSSWLQAEGEHRELKSSLFPGAESPGNLHDLRVYRQPFQPSQRHMTKPCDASFCCTLILTSTHLSVATSWPADPVLVKKKKHIETPLNVWTGLMKSPSI